MEKILSVEDLDIRFQVRGRELHAIRRISLDLYRGESLAIVGESGSGKSVMTRALCGMLEHNGRIAGGRIVFEGRDLCQLSSRQMAKLRGSKIATVFQDPMTSLDPIVPIGRQLTDVIRAHQKCSLQEARNRALEMMEKVGSTDSLVGGVTPLSE